jgi:hypothetical protein
LSNIPNDRFRANSSRCSGLALTGSSQRTLPVGLLGSQEPDRSIRLVAYFTREHTKLSSSIPIVPGFTGWPLVRQSVSDSIE